MCRCCVYSCGESSHDELIVAVYYLLTDDMHMNDTEMKEVHFLIKCLECQVIQI